MLIPSNYFSLFICVVVCLGPFLSAVHLLLALVSLFRLACACAPLVWLPFLGAAGLLSFVAAARCFVVVVVFLLVALVAWCLRFGPLFPVPPLPSPLGCLLVVSGPVSVLLVPPSGYLVVSATVRLSYLWYGVSWLIGSCLHSLPGIKGFGPVWGSALYTMCGCCSCAPRSVTEVFALV